MKPIFSVEFPLGTSYKADYLIVGKSSSGYELVFVELEAPEGRIKREEKYLGEVFNKGLNQINDWDSWLQGNYCSLKEIFYKSKKSDFSLPDEFYQLDTLRLHFVVIAGRRTDFNEDIYRIRLQKRDSREKIQLLHYDNLVDAADAVIGATTTY